MSISSEQFNELFRHCVGFAAQMLQKYGEFYPFGTTVNTDGQIAAADAYTGDAQPDVQEIMGRLAEGFAEGVKKGEVLAVAAVSNVNMPEQLNSPSPDGIRVYLESQDLSRLVYVPYRMVNNDEGGIEKVDFFDAFAADVPHHFFEEQAQG